MSALPNIAAQSLFPMLERSFEGVALATPDAWRIVYVNSTLANWLGEAANDLCGRRLDEIVDDASRASWLEQVERAWTQMAASNSVAMHVRAGGGRVFLAEERLCRVEVDGTPLVGLIVRRRASHRDSIAMIAERRDPLTGLPDRDFLLARLSELMRSERAAYGQFAVLFVDLDNFKQVNDEFGHLVGDQVLREAARRLSACVRDGDSVVRFGGDEFVVLVEGVASCGDIEPIIERLHAALAKPIAIPDGQVTLSLSIGVAEASPDHRSPDDLLRAADRAMYAAKRDGN